MHGSSSDCMKIPEFHSKLKNELIKVTELLLENGRTLFTSALQYKDSLSE
jgi:hypothetical protein